MDLSALKLTAKRKEIAERLDFKTVEDILRYYPFKYDEYKITPYDDFKIGCQVFFEAELISVPSTFRYRRNLSITRFKVLYEEEELNITIFNRPWARNLSTNSKIVIIGKYDGDNKITATNYYTKDIKEIEGIIPYYSLKEGINQNEIRKLIELAYQKSDLVDEIPLDIVQKHQLISYKEAIYNIHFPSDQEHLRKALSRLKYEEFLRFYLALDYIKGQNVNNNKKEKKFAEEKLNEFVLSLPFTLTKDQETCKQEIINDLKSNKTMYRLIQGEVGSGKTALAMIALYGNYLSGYQGALMAPTEILAKQHYASFKEAFKNFNLTIGLLTSSVEDGEKIKKSLKEGKIDIIIGTHALFQESVEFNKLGLVIADEQHRFGVKQRRALKQKGEDVDCILMSATPIPRTLASSIYGDSDVSTIETLPSGRKGCETKLINKNSLVDVIDEIKDKLKEGRQAYVIAAAIEQSENYSAKDAVALALSLSKALKPYQVGLLHGKMEADEKDRIMQAFNDNKIQVLVSTTVVEVGVNVKNATVMAIYDADRFGLAQIHQLRGRIQRGEYQGICYLLTNNKDENVLNRLKVLVNTNDGFKISYEDLRLRGPGDILGTRQSGLPAFILGNLVEDTKFIEAARADAKEIVNNLDNLKYKAFFEKIAASAKKTGVD